MIMIQPPPTRVDRLEAFFAPQLYQDGGVPKNGLRCALR
jgi:hypothetical protein